MKRQFFFKMIGGILVASKAPAATKREAQFPSALLPRLFVSLHTGNPATVGHREAKYTGYQRQEATSGTLCKDYPWYFPQCTDGAEAITRFLIHDGKEILAAGRINPGIQVGVGMTPRVMLEDVS